jgi:medium-chain acyl-[acyl-carrier-protein] hydrolase
MTLPIFNPWIVCSHPRPQAKLRLFCFHYAGGGTLSFRGWSNHLPPTIEVCCIQLPGREQRLADPPFTRLEPLLQALVPAILPTLNQPFAFFGHSMGALIAFELARSLHHTHNNVPQHLFASGYRAPQLPNPDPPIHTLPDAAFINELRRLNGTPEAVLANRELMELLLPTLRADFALIETYTHRDEPALTCPITVFGGLSDPEVSQEELVAWQQHTQVAFSLQMFPGDHFFLHSAQSQMLRSMESSLRLYNGFSRRNSWQMPLA